MRYPKRPTQRNIIIKVSKVKDRENLKSGNGKTTFYTTGNTQYIFSKNFAGQKRVTQYIQNVERKEFQSRIFYTEKLSLRFEGE